MTNAKQALSKKTSNKPAPQDNVRNLLMSMKGEINNALPQYLPADKFVRTSLTAINSNPKLLQCSPQSLLAAVMNSAQLGLEFNTPLGEAYLIPYENKRKGITEVQFQIGYQGLLKLAHNTGQFKRITAKEVHENDDFSINYGTGEIHHSPVIRGESGDVIGYYAVYETKEGGRDSFYMSKEDAEAYGKKFSKSYSWKDSPWQSNFDAMAKKSCIIQVLKYAPKAIDKPELGQAMAFDNQVFKSSKKDEMTGETSFDIDYEVVEEGDNSSGDPSTSQGSAQDDKGAKVDKETGEIIEDDFFGDDFEPVKDDE
ncbi:recombinase RecT [uncultured Anaerococcus sp.]|uniref:recombinase RecT n=1 Tax=uncultured Anaerococcus sp. TaxID=293428 RepID=UPI0025CE5D99|nr:recombinase RecT [uncultured Anaerococcus sp.]